jgi:uncharacterized protein
VTGILIAAIAGRMLANSANRGRYDIAVLDLFNDLDTRRFAPRSEKVPGHDQGLARFSKRQLLEASSRVAPVDGYPGLVYGSGFEDDPETLANLAQGRRLYGNSVATIQATKDPLRFFSALKKCAIPHPEFSVQRPSAPEGWLAKKIGGSGGFHVSAADEINKDDANCYYQRFVDGKNYSVSFIANGKRAQIIGFNKPWSIALGDWRYCYLGAINRMPLPSALVARVQHNLDLIAQEMGLVGLNGMDFIVRGNEYFVIELNPRPSGTLDLYDADCAQGLFHWHLKASDGDLPAQLFDRTVIRAHAVVYAEHALGLAGDVQWPSWCSDIPERGSVFAPRMPVCMVHAEGDDHAAVSALVHVRRQTILNLIKQMPIEK